MGYVLAAYFILAAYINGRCDQQHKLMNKGESYFYLSISFVAAMTGILILGGK